MVKPAVIFLLELELRSAIPYKKLAAIHNPQDIVPIHIESEGNVYDTEKPIFFAIANRKNPNGGYNSSVIIMRYNETSELFTYHQFLPEFAPFEVESFSGKVSPVVHKHFLAVSGK